MLEIAIRPVMILTFFDVGIALHYSGVRTYLNLVPTSSHFQTWCQQMAILPQKIVKNGYFIEKFKKYSANQSTRRYMFSRSCALFKNPLFVIGIFE